MKRIAALAIALVLPASAVSAQVVGGTDVPAGKWQDAAAVYFGGGGPGCTGTLIAPNVAITAGHCIGGISQVMVGTNTLDVPGERLNVVQQIEYPNSQRTIDIGLLILGSDAATKPRTIAWGCAADQFIVDGAEVAVVGYGAINPNGSGQVDELQEAYTTIVDADCSNTEAGCNSASSPGGELTAGGGGIDSCFGDSGGPLYLITPRGDFLVGVTSRGVFAGGQPCGQGGIYGRPDAIIDWIQGQTGVTLPEPICNFAPEPTALAIEVEAGNSESTTITPNDADAADTHTFAVAVAPEHGEVEVAADGTATYTADGDYDGEDAFTIAVTDSGAPAETANVVVLVTVTPAGCGCRTSADPGNAWPAVLALLALLRRPRRSGLRSTHSTH